MRSTLAPQARELTVQQRFGGRAIYARVTLLRRSKSTMMQLPKMPHLLIRCYFAQCHATGCAKHAEPTRNMSLGVKVPPLL